MKSSKVFEPLIYALLLSAGILLGRFSRPGSYSGSDGRLMEALSIIENQYVDTVNMEELSSLAIAEVMQKLDPHSVFIAASEKAQVNAPLDGNFKGIGIEFNVVKDTVFVLRVIEGGPAKKAGISVADRLIAANGKSLVGLSYDEIAGLIKGEEGSTVVLDIVKPNKKRESKKVIRGVVDIPSIPAYYMLNGSQAYLKLDQFSASTTDDFKNAMDELLDSGMKSLVLDLRDNTGGYLQSAIELLDEFIDGKKVLTYTAGRTEPRKEYYSSKGGRCISTGLVVLVNGHSASASELFCGAIQDYKRGKVVGTRTYGKGLVQENFALSDGSLLRLTVARYYTPKGRSIQRSYTGLKTGVQKERAGGITPDVVISNSTGHGEQEDEFANQREVLIDLLEKYTGRLQRYTRAESFANDQELKTAIAQSIDEKLGIEDAPESWKKRQSNDILNAIIRSYLGDSEAIRWKNNRDEAIVKAKAILLQP